MGASNVRLVYATRGALPDQPFRLLVYMALTSLDEDREGTTARRYFAGREPLALALGRDLPGEPQDCDQSAAAVAARRTRNAAFAAVKAALKVLKETGAITVVRQGGFRRQSEYALNLDPWEKKPQGQGDAPPTKQGDPTPQGVGNPTHRGRAAPPPRNHEEQPEDQERGQPHLGPSPHQTPANPVDDDLYLEARKTLERMGADRYERLLSDARAAHPDAPTREIVLTAAQLARGAR